MFPAGYFNRRIRIERPTADDAFDGAGLGQWAPVLVVWANLQDNLPSRGEKLAEGINVANRPTRVRIRFRSGVTDDMRFSIGKMVKGEDGVKVWQADRIVQIISGPAELGNREALEFMVEEYRPAGNAA
ncbi:head-tail adaptor protein [Novosphingobium sp. AP12]|uniref:head-tail adaptor protein n=1 Tax=Novosphingobium sp. AP12 TaxID=1144305 RepID=UPI0002720AEE|nr:head-tail adaptor protein [Novosphingobium sp. AP12]EJL25603.1 bacteriophage head-tail adaptor [Novosphingobium sp. AP12]